MTATPEAEKVLQPPQHFAAAGEGAAALPVDAWWRDFADAGLQELMQQALSDNFSLRAAAARLRQARAAAAREGAAQSPSLSARARYNRSGENWSDASEGGLVELTTSYEVDLWGRIEATATAAQLDAQASAADLRGAALMLGSSLANTWFELLEQRAQLKLIDAQVATNKKLLQLVQARFRTGQAQAAAVMRQRQLLAQTEGERARAEASRAALEHQLAILRGLPPGGFAAPPGDVLPSLTPLPQTGAPADLLLRRPDLVAARLRLDAAAKRSVAATTANLPPLDLSFVLSTPATTGALLSNWLGVLAAQASAPLFDGGRLNAEAQRLHATAAEQVASFNQSLLKALGEVEDALVGERGQQRHLQHLQQQLRDAAGVVELEQRRYFQGDSDYLSVLDALRSQQALQRQQLTAQRQLLAQRIALVRALGGGWLAAGGKDGVNNE